MRAPIAKRLATQPDSEKKAAASPIVVLARPRIPALAILVVLVIFAALAAGYLIFGTRTAQLNPGPEQSTVAAAGSASSPAGTPAMVAINQTSSAAPIDSTVAATGSPTSTPSPPDAICGAALPSLGIGSKSGLPVPIKPCGSDVTQCAQDMDSCLAKARKEDPEAMAQLGYIYLNGLGVAPDYDKAMNWSKIAAYKGNALGQDTMGQLSRLEVGGAKPDYVSAHDSFATAAAQGCSLAETDLGDLYLYGKGVERNASTALEWYKKAADQNDAMGENNLAYLYNLGSGVAKDHKQALAWYLKSAQQGNPLAQDALGYMYQMGLAVAVDLNQSVACYKKAAEQGYAPAQLHLAESYESGDGTIQNTDEAAKWYCKAASAGNVKAKMQIGKLSVDCLNSSAGSARP